MNLKSTKGTNKSTISTKQSTLVSIDLKLFYLKMSETGKT